MFNCLYAGSTEVTLTEVPYHPWRSCSPWAAPCWRSEECWWRSSSWVSVDWTLDSGSDWRRCCWCLHSGKPWAGSFDPSPRPWWPPGRRGCDISRWQWCSVRRSLWRIYLRSFTQTIHSLLVGEALEVNSVHLQQSVTWNTNVNIQVQGVYLYYVHTLSKTFRYLKMEV